MGAICIFILVLAIILLSGKGAGLLAGYNTMSPEKRAKYNMKAVCRFYGWILIVFTVFFAIAWIGIEAGIAWLSVSAFVIAIAVLLIGIAYVNTNKRFRKSDTATDEHAIAGEKPTKAAIITTIVISAVVMVAFGILFYYGGLEPAVTVFNDHVQITCMYGLRVDLSEITGVTLIESNMEDIASGRWTNGYDGFGTTVKGIYRSNEHGEVLLLVKVQSSPTIHIARENAADIYLSLDNSEATERLYHQIMAVYLSR